MVQLFIVRHVHLAAAAGHPREGEIRLLDRAHVQLDGLGGPGESKSRANVQTVNLTTSPGANQTDMTTRPTIVGECVVAALCASGPIP